MKALASMRRRRVVSTQGLAGPRRDPPPGSSMDSPVPPAEPLNYIAAARQGRQDSGWVKCHTAEVIKGTKGRKVLVKIRVEDQKWIIKPFDVTSKVYVTSSFKVFQNGSNHLFFPGGVLMCFSKQANPRSGSPCCFRELSLDPSRCVGKKPSWVG